MARDHPDQLRLAAFLDHAEAAVGNAAVSDRALALRLDVGLPPGVDLLRHHDLDNYLFPLVTRLGPRRFASVWATKQHAADSLIRIDTARRASPPAESIVRVQTTRSAETAAWKEEVRDQLQEADEIPAGPVELQLAYRVGPSRNWANLWKQTIDSLGSILGNEDGRAWNPRDGRIVHLGLHQEVDPAIGHSCEIDVLGRAIAS